MNAAILSAHPFPPDALDGLIPNQLPSSPCI